MARPSHPRSPEMRILCAWCCHEGQPGYLGEREPLDNPEPTHGVCAYHKAQVLESLHLATIATVIQGRDRGDRRVSNEYRQRRARPSLRTGTRH